MKYNCLFIIGFYPTAKFIFKSNRILLLFFNLSNTQRSYAVILFLFHWDNFPELSVVCMYIYIYMYIFS